ncbi:MAG: TatD family hydrolase [Pirellulaceae bacterium]
MIIDTHAHLTDKHFAELEPYLEKAREAQVLGLLAVATTAKDSRECIELSERHSQIRASVGIHPNYCHEAEEGDWEIIEKLCIDPRVAALGETGLDKYWDDCPWEIQVDYFRRHLALSRDTNLPVIIHTRECAQETLEILTREYREFGPIRGVMHSFTGPHEVALGCLELGLYISFAGMLTFKNAQEIRDIAKEIPEDRLLVETDSPYLTPHPFRGQRPNHPALVAETLSCLAETRGISKTDCAAITTRNAERLFGSW